MQMRHLESSAVLLARVHSMFSTNEKAARQQGGLLFKGE